MADPLKQLPSLGQVIDEKYRLVRLIGKGGMGAVYEAEHIEIRKRVAIKFLHADLAEDPEAIARFKREPRAAAATGHEAIIDIYDMGTMESGCPFLVMSFLEGESMASLIAREGHLEVRQATYIVAQVLSALSAVHAKGIVHRDLKTDNIFLVQSGHELPSIKLLDFGTSIITEEGGLQDRLTTTGVVIGTPYYMAPEQLKGQRDIDHRVDLYSVGVVLYEALSGAVPFPAKSLYSLIGMLVDGTKISLRQHRTEIPEQLEAFVDKAMSVECDNRFASAAEMLEELLVYLDQSSISRISLPAGSWRIVDASNSILPEDTFPPSVTAPEEMTHATWRRRPPWLVFSLVVILISVTGFAVAYFATGLLRADAVETPLERPGDQNLVVPVDSGAETTTALALDAGIDGGSGVVGLTSDAAVEAGEVSDASQAGELERIARSKNRRRPSPRANSQQRGDASAGSTSRDAGGTRPTKRPSVRPTSPGPLELEREFE